MAGDGVSAFDDGDLSGRTACGNSHDLGVRRTFRLKHRPQQYKRSGRRQPAAKEESGTDPVHAKNRLIRVSWADFVELELSSRPAQVRDASRLGRRTDISNTR